MATLNLSPSVFNVVCNQHFKWNLYFENLTAKSTAQADLENTFDFWAELTPGSGTYGSTPFLSLKPAEAVWLTALRMGQPADTSKFSWAVYNARKLDVARSEPLGVTARGANMSLQIAATHGSASTLQLKALSLTEGDSFPGIIKAGVWPSRVRYLGGPGAIEFDPSRCDTETADVVPVLLTLPADPTVWLWARNPATSYIGDSLAQPETIRFLTDADLYTFPPLLPGRVHGYTFRHERPIYVTADAPTTLEYYFATPAELREFWPSVNPFAA